MPSIRSESDLKNTLRDSNGRVSQFSYIRVIACMAIVVLHTVNSARVYHAEEISAGQTLTAYTVCSMLMWAVPCFLMVSGALLLDPAREITWSKIFGKYIRRMFTALVIFTAIFTVIRHDPKAGTSMISEFFNGLAFNHCMAYLWYLYLMIAIYLLLPLLRKAASSMSDTGLCILALVLMLASLIMQVLLNGADGGSRALLGIALSLQLLACGVAYAIAGRLIYMKRMNILIAASLFVVSSALLGLGTLLAGQKISDPSFISAYCSPLVVIQSVSVYSLMLGIKAEAGSFISSVDKCSFGIYLIHMIFVRLCMSELGINAFDYGPFGFIFLSAVFFLAAYGASWVIKRFTGSNII